MPHMWGHRDVDAGRGTLLLGKVLPVAYLMGSSIRTQDQTEVGRGQASTRLSPEPCISTGAISLDVSVSSTSRDLLSVVDIFQSSHSGKDCVP